MSFFQITPPESILQGVAKSVIPGDDNTDPIIKKRSHGMTDRADSYIITV